MDAMHLTILAAVSFLVFLLLSLTADFRGGPRDTLFRMGLPLAVGVPGLVYALLGIGPAGWAGAWPAGRLALVCAAIVLSGSVTIRTALPALRAAAVVGAVGLLLAAGAGVQAVYVPVVGTVALSPVASAAFTVAWVALVTVVYTLSGTLDGIASGLGFMSVFFWALISWQHGLNTSALVSSMTTGAIAGLLIYTLPPATRVTGRSDNALIGVLVAVMPLVGSPPAARPAVELQLLPLATLFLLPILAAAAGQWRGRLHIVRNTGSTDSVAGRQMVGLIIGIAGILGLLSMWLYDGTALSNGAAAITAGAWIITILAALILW